MDSPAHDRRGLHRYGGPVFELNLPNLLTVFRILLVPVLVAALLAGTDNGDLLAAAVFAVASVTDFFDGWIARRRQAESNFGKLMDPLADKLLVTAALVALVSLNRVAAWVAMVIIAREFAVTGLRTMAMEQGYVVSASIWGKLKTVVQIIAVMSLIAYKDSPGWVDALVYAAVIVTVMSGADYFFGHRKLLSNSATAPTTSQGTGT
jgi:CDP-diacylglycerol--glycerol-3-phosphate 3-phosphatidyltransferase